MSRARRTVGLVAAVVFLQAVAVVPWHAAHTWSSAMTRISPDLLVIAGAVAVGALAGWRRLAAHVGALTLVLAILLREAIALLPLVFQRPFDLADFGQVPGLVHLLTVNKTTGEQVLLWSIVAGVLVLGYWLAARSLTAMRGSLGHRW
jgi:hypothetical protein